MQELYVVGGQEKKNAASQMKDWHHQHLKGIVLQVDPETDNTDHCLDYISPVEVRAGVDAAVLFKSATVQDGKIYLCTPTEVLIYSLPDFKQVGYVSLPCFNDVHHVRPTPEGNLIIANTGLDMVVVVSLQGDVLREWNTMGQDPWERFSKDVDYRHVISTQPHQSHPNNVFYIGEDIWVTRFKQKDALCLTQPDRRIPIDVQRVHDGYVHGESVYFTTVNGFIVVAGLETLKIKETYNLAEFSKGDPHHVLGWCRGLHVLDDDLIAVGFSRLRPTRFAENVRWAKYYMGMRKDVGPMPTRVAIYDLKKHLLCWEMPLEDLGVNTKPPWAPKSRSS